MDRLQWRTGVLLLLCLLWWGRAEGGYVPVYSNRSTVFFNVSESYRFPDIRDVIPVNYNYFISELNFEAMSGRLLVGAADKLYLLGTNLTWSDEYTWRTEPALLSGCTGSFACRNHIRVYKKFPSEDRLVVCGTQAAQDPQCRTLPIANGRFGSATPNTTASNGLISYYPEFSGFGEFRNSDSSDTTYFSAGFFAGTDGIGRHFSISYQTVDYQPDPVGLNTSVQFRTIRSNNYWLRFPVDFVDYYRADYQVKAPATQRYQYQFYFVFLRENLFEETNSFDIIYSRVVRICRNDPGSDPQTGARHFTTYMKARIYCEREVPPGREYTGALDYQYNEMRSMVFNNQTGGRYSESGSWVRMMYGAFSGPTIGPAGTAICAYRADNSLTSGRGGHNLGIFDIFREDIRVNAVVGGASAHEEENRFTECNPAGRSAADSEKVLIVQDVKQIGEDPLIVFDGIYVTKMVLDQVCVVASSNPSACYGHDILFLGTDTGKVMKVVFTADNTPVITEEISFDDNNEIKDMKIETVNSTKQLFVSTISKIYRLPLERCSRHIDCRECVGARDPYCVWNTNSRQCETTSLRITDSTGGTGTVTSNIKQNIHSGSVDTCPADPVCDVSLSSTSYNSVQVALQCNHTTNVIVRTNLPPTSQVTGCGSITSSYSTSITLTLSADGTSCASFTGGYGLQTYWVNVTTSDGRLTALPACVTTEPGPPLQLQDTEVLVDRVTNSSFRVTVNLASFTDYFRNHQFRVYYNKSDSPTDFQALTDGASVTVAGLTAAETVLYWVEVTNSRGSNRSLNNFTVTLRDSAPGPVRSLKVTDITNTSVSLSWAEPAVRNGVIDGYSVYVNSRQVVSCVSLQNPQYTAMGLQPSTRYTFSVRACTDAGEGMVSEVTNTTECGVAGPVQNIRVSASNSNSLSYAWNIPSAVNGVPSTIRYSVIQECYDSIRGVQTNMFTITTTTLTTRNLDPLTYCCVTVRAIHTCEIDGGDREVFGLPAQLCGQTLDTAPLAVSNLNVLRVSPSALLPTWEPPSNYQRRGLNYTITVNSAMGNTEQFTVTDRLSYYIDSLTSNTLYSVTVKATSTAGMGPREDRMVTTLPSAPPPPQNLRLTAVDSDTVQLIWNDSNRQSHNVTQYFAVLRCNEALQNDTTTDMSIRFTIPRPTADFAWCTAQVQSVNTIGRSAFSDLANVVVPSRAPEQPRCFLVDDIGSQVSITFDVTYPFSVEGMRVEWNLNAHFRTEAVRRDTFNFNSSTSNRISIPVSRNTRYDFQLRVCNRHGCSGYCQLSNFTTSSSSPRPPDIVNTTNITCCSANVTWNLPPFEDQNQTQYSVQISSSCGMQEARNLSQRWYIFTDLCYETSYTAAVKVFDNDSNIEGYYGPAHTFQTLSGTPSKPRDVTLMYNDERKLLEVYWAIPQFPNGNITMYEVQWSNSSQGVACENANGNIQSANVTDTRIKSYKTSNTRNVNQTQTILVCVRAYTSDAEPSLWEFDFKADINTGQLTGNTEESGQSGLIAVAAVASFAIICTVVATLILSFVIAKRWQCCHTGEKYHSEPYNGEKYNDEKFEEETKYDESMNAKKFQTMRSIDSSSPFFTQNGTSI